MSKSINLDTIAPGTNVLIRGKVAFSKITSQFEGEELRKRNERLQARGGNPIATPYTTMTISNPVVLTRVPNQKQPIETWAEEGFYTREKSNGLHFTGINKGNSLPTILVKSANTSNNEYKKIIPEYELAVGLDVTLMIRVFRSNKGLHHGTCMDAILVNEPIRYYESNKLSNSLKAYGITYVDDTPDDSYDEMGIGSIDEYQEVLADTGIPVSMPTSNPFSANNMNNNAPAAQNNGNNANYYQQNAYGQNAAPNTPTGGNNAANTYNGQGSINYDAENRNY